MEARDVRFSARISWTSLIMRESDPVSGLVPAAAEGPEDVVLFAGFSGIERSLHRAELLTARNAVGQATVFFVKTPPGKPGEPPFGASIGRVMDPGHVQKSRLPDFKFY